MRTVSFEELMQAVDFMSNNQYAYGDQIPEDMEYNGFQISFRNSNQFHQCVVSVVGRKIGSYVYYDNNMPMKIHSGNKEYTPREYFIAYVNDVFHTKEPKPIDPNVYGFVNGKPVYSRDEFIFTVRGFGAIEDDNQLIMFAEKKTGGWYDAGWCRTFTTYYLDNDNIRRHLTLKELARLKELQKIARQKEKEADDARQWHKIETLFWADNSVEEIWEDKDGIKKTVMVEGPHGDACY